MNFYSNAAKMVAPFVLAFVAAGGQAQAATLDFDSLSSASVVASGYGGLNWDNFWAFDTSSYQSSGYVNGTVSPHFVALNAWEDPASFSSSVLFTFNSAYFTAAWNTGLTVEVKGFQGGNLVNSTSFTVDTVGPSLITFNWADINQVTFVSYGGVDAGYGGGGTHFAMDNVTINAVPEPGALALVLAGLGVFGVIAKRRTA